MIKDVKVYFKSLKGRMVLTVAGISTGAMVLSGCSGCSTEKIDSVDDPSEVILSEVPSEIEIIETSEPLEDEKMPEFILKNEDGSYYQPQHVKADDIYKRIDEVKEKYRFENDWERDRFVGILLLSNNWYMSDEDIIAIYEDYLVNFGMRNLDDEIKHEYTYVSNNTNKIAYKDLFIDERLAKEAAKIEEICDNGDKELLKEKLLETVKGNSHTYPFACIYTQLFNDDTNVLYSDEYIAYFSDCYDMISIGRRDYDIVPHKTLKYEIDEYVSSHDDAKVKELEK